MSTINNHRSEITPIVSLLFSVIIVVSLFGGLRAQTLPSTGMVLHYDAQDIDGDDDLLDQPSNGSSITTWVNKSSADDGATTAGNEPTFDANGLNSNGAVSFDGVNDLFTIANSDDLNTEATTNEISLAIVLETGASVAGDQILYEQGGGLRGYSFVIQNSHIYAGVWNNNEWDAGHQYKSVDLGTVSANTTYFITIVQNSSSGVDATNVLSIYLNGSLVSSVNHVDPQKSHGGAIGLGRINGATVLPADNSSGNTGNTVYFQGLIGEFLIWKSALSSTEINDLNTYFLDRWGMETPPSLDLNGLASNGQDFQTQFSEGGVPVNIANSGSASITDIESTHLSKMTFKVDNLQDASDELLNINGTDIVLSSNGASYISAGNGLPKLKSTVSAGTGDDAGKQILLLQAVDGSNVVIDLSISDAQTILRGITYEDQLATVTTGIRDIEITATDTDSKESAVVNSEVDVIAGAPSLDLNGPVTGGGNYSTSYVYLTTENISDATATVTTTSNISSLELFLEVQDLNLENFNISGTAIDISSNGVTNITTTPENLTVTVSEVLTGLNAGKQSVLIEPANPITAAEMQTLLVSITYEHVAGTFSTGDRVIGVVVTDENTFSSSQANAILDIASPPVNSVPGQQTVDANTLVSISNITCSDEDGDLTSVRLETDNSGDLDITVSGGVVLTGNGIDILILTGNETDINATLATLQYTSVITTGTEILEVTATDNLAATDIDEIPISISPPPLSGLVLHYDAQDIDGDDDFADQPTDGSNVTTWVNKSSSDNGATTAGNEPTFSSGGLNSNDAVSFDGVNDLFTIANSDDLNTEATTNEISLAIVLETGASIAGDQIIYEQGGTTRGYSFVIQNNHIYAGVWNSAEWDAGHQYKSVDLGTVSANTTYFITIVQNSSSGVDATNTLSIYLNGSLVSSVNHVDPQSGHSDGIGLGRINGGTVLPADNVDGSTANTDYFQGLIGEFMIWKSALSTTEISDLNAYFLDRWGILTPPALDLNGLASNGQDFQTQFSEGGVPVNIANSGSATITDIESTHLTQMTFKVDNLQDASDELLNINGTDIVLSSNGASFISAGNGLPKLKSTVSAGTGGDAGKQILLLESVDASDVVIDLSIADAQTILRGITYENQLATVTTGIRDIEITATDTDSKESAVVNSEVDVIAGAPSLDLNGPVADGGNYSTNYVNETTENISDATATVTTTSNVSSLELFLEVQDLNLENFNISGTAIDISSNGVTNITTTPENLTVTVSEVLTGLNAGKQSVLIEPANPITAAEMQTLLVSITYEHVAGTFSSNDRVIGVVVVDENVLSSSQVNTTLVAIDEYTWTGTTNSTWSVTTNWDNSLVPPNNANVIIPNTANQPQLGQNTIIGDLTCTSSTLDLNTFDLNVTGDVSINASAISGGELIFSGTTKQFVSIVGTLNVEEVMINNSNGVEILTGDIRLSNTLTLTIGDLITNSGLTLASTASQTARLAEIIGGSIVGNITMERYFAIATDGGATTWRDFSSCIIGATIDDWQDDFATCGFPGATSQVCGGFISAYYYDESLDGGLSSGGWQAVPSSAQNTLGAGINMYVSNNDFTLDVTGVPNTGTYVYNGTSTPKLTFTDNYAPDDDEDGWNLLGNPFPSSIDWNKVDLVDKNNIDNVIYTFNAASGQYGTYTGGAPDGTNGVNNIIPSTQAFWVHANAANPSLTIKEEDKDATDKAIIKSLQYMKGYLKISISSGINNYRDEMIVVFDVNGSTNYVDSKDAIKLATIVPEAPSISVFSDDESDITIKFLPTSLLNLVVPLIVDVGVSGNYTIKVEAMGDMENMSVVDLYDASADITTNLTLDATYDFSITDSESKDRFYLNLSGDVLTKEIAGENTNDVRLYPNPSKGFVYLEGEEINHDKIEVFDLLGKAISIKKSKVGANKTRIEINAEPGSYLVKFHKGDQLLSRKINVLK